MKIEFRPGLKLHLVPEELGVSADDLDHITHLLQPLLANNDETVTTTEELLARVAQPLREGGVAEEHLVAVVDNLRSQLAT